MRLSGIRTPDREASSQRTRQRRSCPQVIEITREPKWHGLCFRLGDMQVGHSAHITPTATLAMPAAGPRTRCSTALCRTISQRCSTPRAIFQSRASAIPASSSVSSRSSSHAASSAMDSCAYAATRAPRSDCSHFRARRADSALRVRVAEWQAPGRTSSIAYSQSCRIDSGYCRYRVGYDFCSPETLTC
jgi:hypothetical protein